jgi:hypothetical protein
MAKEEVYKAVKESCTILGKFFTEVSQDVGLERAAAMYGRVFDGIGEMMGGVVEQNLGDAEAAGNAAAQLEQMYDAFGINPDMEIGPTRIQVHTRTCPFYDGYAAAGLHHDTIEAMCRSAVACEAAAFKRIVPDGNLSLHKFRATPDDFCTEAIDLA